MQELRFSKQGEKLVGKQWDVLDKGYVKLVSYHGTDQLIESAARTSYQAGTRSVSDTRRLIRYLYSHAHHSPFEMPCCIFELKMPLLVIQQLLRHRVAKLNQESHRYSRVSDDKYQVDEHSWRQQSKSNKQGSADFITDWPENWTFENGTVYGPDYSFSSVNDISTPGKFLSHEEEDLQEKIKAVYDRRISLGVAKEQARKETPHSTYSKLYWQMDLRNLLHFMSLRCDSHAQKEIRDYSNIIAGVVKILFPLTFEAWYDYTYNSTTLSLLDRKFLSYLMKKYTFDDFDHLREKHEQSGDQYPISILGMTKREVSDFWSKFEINEKQDFDLEV